MRKGLITGDVIVTDSTYIKARASKSKVEKVVVEKTPSQYLNTLEEEAKKIEKHPYRERCSREKANKSTIQRPIAHELLDINKERVNQ